MTAPEPLEWRLQEANTAGELVVMLDNDRWLAASHGLTHPALEAIVRLLNGYDDDAPAAPPRFLTVRDPDLGDWLLIDTRPGGSVGRREAQLLARFTASDAAAIPAFFLDGVTAAAAPLPRDLDPLTGAATPEPEPLRLTLSQATALLECADVTDDTSAEEFASRELLRSAVRLGRAVEVAAASEREEWAALAQADTLHMLPPEALVASVRHLAGRLLELTGENPVLE